ncbi:hypothetical protein THAOC_10333, partial [Thalassiosira oceanica]
RTSVTARPRWVQGWIACDIPAGDAPQERRVVLPRSLASPRCAGRTTLLNWGALPTRNKRTARYGSKYRQIEAAGPKTTNWAELNIR